ncbi:MAG TPA: 4Fe-4S binding protein [Chloroflexota bacterium]|nr:4Fe-4S binding protein [Chloroflexota bacterium]
MSLALPEILAPQCTGCGTCVEVCHALALALVAATAVLGNPERCDYCTECELVCPAGAIICPFELYIDEQAERGHGGF